MIQLPTAYAETYAKARGHDQGLAVNYIRHTTLGDPKLDPVMEELSCLPTEQLHRFIRAGVEEQDEELRKAPRPLREFFANLEEPEWLDYDAFRPGIRAFHANVDLMLVAFVTAVLVEGFSTMIAKSLNITGRVASTKRRLQQNYRHMMDIFFPGGLYRNGDGWKLSMRIRIVHSRIRALLNKSGEWNREAWGTPVSAAHLGLAISVFSKRLLEYSQKVGANFTEEEKNSVLDVWRYTGFVMGIPETILYTDGEAAARIYKVGYLCEPPPDPDSVAVANMLIQAIPTVADITDPKEQEKLTALAYRLSRALIGQERAEQFEFPKTPVLGTLFLYRLKQRFQRMLKGTQLVRSENFTQLLQISVYDKDGLSYRMPDHVHTSRSIEW